MLLLGLLFHFVFRKDHERGREKDERDSRRADASDRGLRDGLGGKDRGSRETTLERGGGSRVGKEDSGSRRDDSVSSRKRESQMLPGIVEKTAQDRDFMSKSMWTTGSVPQKVCWEWVGQEHLWCTLSQNVSTPTDASHLSNALLETTGVQCFEVCIDGVRVCSMITPLLPLPFFSGLLV